MTLRVAELEALFTADIRPFEQAAVKVEARRKDLTKAPTEVKVDADVKPALAGIDRVEAARKRVVSAKTALEVDAEIGKAEKNLTQIRADLEKLRKQDVTPQVTADISKAEKALSSAESELNALKGMRAEVIVEADTSQAEGALDDIADKAQDAGDDGGRRSGKALAAGIVGALAAIPIAGAIVGIAKAAGDAVAQGFEDGLAVEVRSDRLAAQTGLDQATVARLGAAAGEAYASNFGESIDANMGAARQAVQSGLLDPKATQRDAQSIIQSLSGVADILDEDVSRVARSTAQLIRTGIAGSAREAFDIIVKGQQAGLNVSEDWLDTLDEYSTQFRKLGLQGPQALGLLSQGVKAGARDTDVAADALKEFSIRAIDGSKTTIDGFKAIGLSATDMADRIARGGPEAAEALGLTLDKLREVDDPTARAAAAVALFGTQAEDMGAALYAMDLSSAVEQLGSVDGAAQRALTTLGDNAAGTIESARRNIEVATDGIKGALAEAFEPQIEGFAEFVTENREAVIKFLLDIADGAIGFGTAMVEGVAAGTEALGNLAGGPIAQVIDALADMAVAMDHAMPGDQHAKAFREWADGAIDNLKQFDEGTEHTADQIREKLITNALEPAREKLNELGDGLLTNAALSDATNRLANDIADVGYAADGSKLAIGDMNGVVDTSTAAGARLDEQIRAVRDGLYEQIAAAQRNGESQGDLRGRVEQARQAFIDQMTAMGMSADAAGALADQYGLISGDFVARIEIQGADEARAAAQAVYDQIAALPTAKYITVGVIDNYSRTAAQIYSASGGNPPRHASGGAIVGPGGPRDDRILSLLSNGEHVIPADEVQAAGGQGAVYRLRDLIRRGVARFAGGGAVGRWEKERDSARAEAERAWAAASAAWNRGDDPAWRDWDKKWKAADDRYRTAVANLAKVRAEGSEVAQEARRGNLAGTASQSLSGAYSLVDRVAAAGGDELLSKSQRSSLTKAAASAEKEYQKLHGTLDKVTAQLDAAREKADQLRQVAKGAADQVSSGFTLAGQGDLLTAKKLTVDKHGVGTLSDPTARDVGTGFLARAKAYAAKATTLATKLASLVKKGLPYRLVDEVLQYGVDGGALEAADGLLALSSGELASLKAAYAQIDKTASAIGNTMAEAYSPGGVAAADAAVKAAEKSQDKVVTALDDLGARLETALLNAYGGKRAAGGPVSAGVAYTVGERGQETFVAPADGVILPNGTGLGSVVNNIKVTTTSDHPERVAAAVGSELAWQMRR